MCAKLVLLALRIPRRRSTSRKNGIKNLRKHIGTIFFHFLFIFHRLIEHSSEIRSGSIEPEKFTCNHEYVNQESPFQLSISNLINQSIVQDHFLLSLYLPAFESEESSRDSWKMCFKIEGIGGESGTSADCHYTMRMIPENVVPSGVQITTFY